tara:strand:- start:1718 stop:2035 length:318 start_codon:yes stop_codon:yes gene_type:complete
MNRLNIFRGIFLGVILLVGARAEHNNRDLQERLTILEEGIYYNTSISDDTAMKFETFLQALSNELPTEVEAYATKAAERVARETTISTLKQFSENLKKIDVKLDK